MPPASKEQVEEAGRRVRTRGVVEQRDGRPCFARVRALSLKILRPKAEYPWAQGAGEALGFIRIRVGDT